MPLPIVYKSMRQRCYDPNHMAYHNYGGRGIRICIEWLHDKYKFIAWAQSNGYMPGLTLDRIDNDGPYSPDSAGAISVAPAMPDAPATGERNGWL